MIQQFNKLQNMRNEMLNTVLLSQYCSTYCVAAAPYMPRGFRLILTFEQKNGELNISRGKVPRQEWA